MRGIPARVLGAVAVGAAVAATAACGNSKETKAACDVMKADLARVASDTQIQLTEPAAGAKTYTDAATRIRSQAAKADGEVKDAANKVAGDMEALAGKLRLAAQGTGNQLADTNALLRDSAALQTACVG
jgi:hypothetical protein